MRVNKLLIFDGDNTLWSASEGDYVSKLRSSFLLSEPDVVRRIADGAQYELRAETRNVLQYLKERGFTIGIVSDNKSGAVIEVLKLFNIWQYYDLNAINIKLWDGYCPKHLMIEEILGKSQFEGVERNNVYWVDDRDYGVEAKIIAVKFVLIKPLDNMWDIARGIAK